MQTYGVLQEVMEEHSQTFGLVMGGVNRNGEASKLAKGEGNTVLVVIWLTEF